VWHVWIGEELHLLACQKWTEESLANQRLGDVGPEQVRGAHADRAHLSRAVSSE
jgi:hypothetical protein